MFLEPNYRNQRMGWIEVICGSMFSGKTEELIRRLRRAEIAGQVVKIFTPSLDTRYNKNSVVSHDKASLDAEMVSRTESIPDLVEGVQVVGIDEAQFFAQTLVTVCEQLTQNNIRVIVAGLDLDYRGEPFEPVPSLMAVAEYVTKVHAICVRCGSLATHSYRLTADTDKVLVGEKELYEARCRACFLKGSALPFEE